MTAFCWQLHFCRPGWWKPLDRHAFHITSDQMQWKQEGTAAPPPPSGPSSRPLCHSVELTAGSNKTHTHTQDCQMSEWERHKLGFGSLFIFADYLISQTCSFLLPNQFQCYSLGDQSFHSDIILSLSTPWKEVKMDKWWCVVSINTEASSSVSRSLRTNRKSGIKTFHINIYFCLRLSRQLSFSGSLSFWGKEL